MMLSMMRILTMAVLAVALGLSGCHKPAETAATQSAGTEKRYAMKGVIKSLDPAAKLAAIDAEKIDNWMEAMMMDYTIKPDAEFQKLHVGDKIEAVVVVNDPVVYVTDIKVLPK